MTLLNWHKHAAIGAGFVLSAFFLWVALRQVDGVSLVNAFATMNLLPVVFCAGALSVGILLRGIRWRVIAGSLENEQKFFSRATNLGVLANLIFPGRVGEFVRVITLAKLSNSSLPRPLASAFIDRLVDVFILAACASILYWVLPIGTLVGKWLTVFLIAGCVVTVLVVVYARSSGLTDVLISRLAKRWLQRWPLKPEVFLAELRNEFRSLLGSWLSVKLIALALLILCFDYAAIAGLIQAFDLEATLLLWVFLAAWSALPSAPGYIGVYQVAAVWALSFYAVPAPTAVAIATVLQVITLVVATLMAGSGALAIFKRILFQKRTVPDRWEFT